MSTSEQPNINSLQVLVIEDDPGIQELVKISLTKLGFSIIAKSSGVDAIEHLKSETPDIILLDFGLPDTNGIELLQKIKENQLALPPFIVTTGQGDESLAVQMMKLGAQDYIVKDAHFLDILPQVVNRVSGEIDNKVKRKKAEMALKKYQAMQHTMISNISDVIAIMDKDAIIQYKSPNLEKHFGWKPEELVGFEEWKTIHPEDLDSMQKAFTKLKEKEGATTTVEYRYLCKDNCYKMIQMTATNLIHDSNVNGILLNYHDITQRKLAELNLKAKNEEYIALNTELQNSIIHIKRINSELAQAKEKAEESDRLKSAFLANISHEIRTPMNGILGFADLLKSPELTGDQQATFIQIIESSGKRMLNIINHLIDISKIEAGQMDIYVEVTPVYPVMEELWYFFKAEADQKKIKLTLHNAVDIDDCIVSMDEVRIVQVLSNLLNNALKFTEEGEITIGCRKKESEIEFFVQDTGIGISPLMKGKIFDRFRQVEDSYSRNYEGSGLGLSISKAFVELHGGSIWVESEIDVGSTFFFTIPVVPNDVNEIQAEKEPEAEETKISGAITILVVEDDEVSRFYLEETLREEGVDVILATNGQEAVDLAMQNPSINMILMDMKMPVMDGSTATKLIKEKLPYIPIIAQTAFALSNEKQQVMEAGWDDYLSKPIKRDLLLATIQKHIKKI
jgi:PAS domain S-box-containing protein